MESGISQGGGSREAIRIKTGIKIGVGRRWPAAAARRRASEELAQGTLEYALTVAVLLAIVIACAALWRAAQDGVLAHLAAEAASHALSGAGAVDISLY